MISLARCRKKNRLSTRRKMPPIKVIYQLSHGKPQRHQLKLTSDWQQTLRNVTEIISESFFRRSNRRNETEISKYIKWKVFKKCKPYSNISKKCNLCLYEKFIIICKKELCSLNRQNELASSCPHRNKYVLQNSVE